MEPTHTDACPKWAEQIAAGMDAEGQSLPSALTAHLATCAGCAQAARETAALKGALGALGSRPPSAQFEARLAARLASAEARREQRSWRTYWAGLWPPAPRVLRPALALGAMSLALGGAALFGHLPPPTVTTPPGALAADRSLVSHCVEQHRTEADAQPLSDLSAQNLASQMDGGAPADAGAGAASEDGL